MTTSKKEKKKKYTSSEYRQTIEDLYGPAEMYWRKRMGGSVAAEILQKACEMMGKEYEETEYEKENS